jgi:hypothetical protein
VNRVHVRLTMGQYPPGKGTLVQDYSPLSRIDTLVTRKHIIVACYMPGNNVNDILMFQFCGRQVMVPRLVEGGCLYCTLGGPGSIPVEAVRASNVLFHDLVLLVL